MTDLPEAYVWRESPNGYTLHQRLVPTITSSYFLHPFLSPNGESLIVFFNYAIHLFSTTDQNLSPSSIPTEKRNGNKPFILEVSTDGTLAGFVRSGDNVITVLDLQSGDPRVVIDAGMRVGGLGVAGSAVVIIGAEGRIVTWSLLAENDTQKSRVNIANIQTTILAVPLPTVQLEPVSVSPDLSLVAIGSSRGRILEVYDTPTGRRLAAVSAAGSLQLLRFTPNGGEIWGVYDFDAGVEGWEIPQNRKSDRTELKSLGRTAYQPKGFPWQSHLNYKVADDGWVLSPTQTRLLWLPHPHDRKGGGLIVLIPNAERKFCPGEFFKFTFPTVLL